MLETSNYFLFYWNFEIPSIFPTYFEGQCFSVLFDSGITDFRIESSPLFGLLICGAVLG